MTTSRITELLKEPIKEVKDTAALLQIQRRPDENEATFRTRCAYAMMERLYLEAGRTLPAKVQERIAFFNLGNSIGEGELL